MFSSSVNTINNMSLIENKVVERSTNKCVGEYTYPGPFKVARKYAQDTMSSWVKNLILN